MSIVLIHKCTNEIDRKKDKPQELKFSPLGKRGQKEAAYKCQSCGRLYFYDTVINAVRKGEIEVLERE